MQSIAFYRRHKVLTAEQRQALGLDSPSHASADERTLVGDPSAVEKGEKGNKTECDPFIVQLEGDEDPTNWSLSYKAYVTMGVCQIALVTTFASAAFSPCYDAVAAEFGIGDQVAYLGTSLFLVGFGFGALLCAPLSEMIGRSPVYLGSLLAFSLFQIGAAVSPTWYGVMICRLFAGFFGATPLSNAGGSIADMLSGTMRTVAGPAFACSGFIAPTIAPTISSFIVSSAGGWRWTQYLAALWGFAVLIFVFFSLPETFAASLIEIKVASLNKQHNTDRFMSPRKAETGKAASFNYRELGRAIEMLVTEPIVAVMTFYMLLVYLILFGDLEAYPLIFGPGQWDFTLNQIGLTFLPLVIGVIICSAATPAVMLDYLKRCKRINGHWIDWRRGEDKVSTQPPPEVRLVPICWACWLLPVSMFWMAFTTFPSISPWPAIVSGTFFGTALLFIFIASYQYVIDSYESSAASALAAMTFARYVASGGIVHATAPMMKAMTFRGGFSLFGGVSLAMCLAPFLLIRYGKALRQRSKFARPKEDEPELGPTIV